MPSLDISTWERIFQELIQQKEPRTKWSLKLDENIIYAPASGWKQFQQEASGKFFCSKCQRCWTSAQVKILCHMYYDSYISQGQVLMRIFAQRCQKCCFPKFETPEVSPDSMMTILENLVQRILYCYYGHERKQTRVRREVPWSGPHDTRNCEACTLGCCARNKEKPPQFQPPSPERPHISPPCGGNTLMNEPRASNSLGEGLLILGIAFLATVLFNLL